MTRFATPLLAIAALGLAGCTTYYDPPPAAPVTSASGAPVTTTGSAPVVSASATPAAYRVGQGIIESISLVTLPASAAAGATLPPQVSGPYRVNVRMDDGPVQTLIVDNRSFLVGDRVQILSDGRLNRP